MHGYVSLGLIELLHCAGDPNCLHIPSLTLEAGNTYTLVVSDGDDLDAVLPASVVHSLEVCSRVITLGVIACDGRQPEMRRDDLDAVLSAPHFNQTTWNDVLLDDRPWHACK